MPSRMSPWFLVPLSVGFVALIIVVFCSKGTRRPLSSADFAGTWKIDAHCSVSQEAFDTNSFSIVLNMDGTFTALNVPANYFVSSRPQPAQPKVQGTWKWNYNQRDNVIDLLMDFPDGCEGTYISADHGAPSFTLSFGNRSTLCFKRVSVQEDRTNKSTVPSPETGDVR